MKISSKFCLVAPLLLVLSAGCDDDTGRDLAINEGRLELDPPILDFGLVQVNTEVSAKVVIVVEATVLMVGGGAEVVVAVSRELTITFKY